LEPEENFRLNLAAMMKRQKSSLGIFTLSMISVAAVLSVRNYPSMAEEGWSMIFWYFIGSFFFLLPLALVSAELASAWPQEGGVYAWVKEAFGIKSGFMSIWAVFVENIPWYPTVLSFMAVTIAYIFNPDLANNHLFVGIVMLMLWWGLTLLNFLGPDLAARFSSSGTILGAIVPSFVLIALGIAWLIMGKPSQLPSFGAKEILPGSFNTGVLVYASSIILMFAGVEMSGYYANHVDHPQRKYPKAMFLATLLIFLLSVFGTLPIAMVVPAGKISLTGGVIQVMEDIFTSLGIRWVTPVMALFLVIGGIALLSTWMLGPLISMAPISRAGFLPPVFRKQNRHHSPVGPLLIQGVLATLLILAMMLIPNINTAYWILTSFTTLLLTIYYLPVFAAVIKLRYSQPDTPRPFRIWGGTAGVWILSGTGFLATAFAGFMALTKPDGVTMLTGTEYLLVMVSGTLIWMIPYLLFRWFRKSS